VHNLDASCATEFGAKQPSIVLFSDSGEKVNIYTGEPTKKALKTYLKPLVSPSTIGFSTEMQVKIFTEE